MGTIRKIWKLVEHEFGYEKHTSEHKTSKSLSQSFLPISIPLNDDTVLCFSVYAGSLAAVQHVMSKIEKVIKENFGMLSIKVENIPQDWDKDILETYFDHPDLGGGEIVSIRGDVITFKDPKGQSPLGQQTMIHEVKK